MDIAFYDLSFGNDPSIYIYESMLSLILAYKYLPYHWSVHLLSVKCRCCFLWLSFGDDPSIFQFWPTISPFSSPPLLKTWWITFCFIITGNELLITMQLVFSFLLKNDKVIYSVSQFLHLIELRNGNCSISKF